MPDLWQALYPSSVQRLTNLQWFLNDPLAQFPLGAYNAGPYALVGAVSLAWKQSRTLSIQSLHLCCSDKTHVSFSLRRRPFQ